MLIQNIGSAASASGFASDSGPVAIVTPKSRAAPVDLPQVAVNAAAEQKGMQPTSAQLKTAVDKINSELKQHNANVEFSIDKDTKQTVIKVVESQTGEVIRQFPSKEVMAISRAIGEMQQGMLMKQKA